MAKKHKHPEHENLERWLVSYADFMTLLFATFTSLYALSLADANKLKDVSEAIAQGFEQQSIISGIKSILQGKSAPNHNPDPVTSNKGGANGVMDKFRSMTYKPGEIESTKEFVKGMTQDAQEINQLINQINHAQALQGDAQGGQTAEQGSGQGGGQGAGLNKEDKDTPIRPVEVAVQERGVRVSIDSRMLFAPGSAVIQKAGEKALNIVGQRLQSMSGNIIHVEGHTDGAPIATAQFPSNWELSTGRASSIVRYFIGHQHLDAHRLVAVGYADTQPLTSNSTPEGRAKNRRVDIVLYNQQASAVSNTRFQYLKEAPVPVAVTPIKQAEDAPDLHTKVDPVLSNTVQDGPVKVIIKEKDGTERVLVPKTHTTDPLKKPEIGAKIKPSLVKSEGKPQASAKPESPSHP